ncbi:MAG: hypothetical protein OEV91_08495 [Desulfobulbaceae bacterium]|nr:hypothetical protein [Desulfobulbaceae bacterium]
MATSVWLSFASVTLSVISASLADGGGGGYEKILLCPAFCHKDDLLVKPSPGGVVVPVPH